MSTPTFTYPINNASTVLAQSHSVNDGVLVVAANVFGSPSTDAPIRVTCTRLIDQVSVTFKITHINGTTLTIDSTMENTSDVHLNVNDPVQILQSAGYMSDAYNAILAAPAATLAIGSTVTDSNPVSLLFADASGNLGNDTTLVYSSGKIGIGNSSPTAKLQVTCGSPSTIGQILQGAASQSANLTNWTNSSGSTLLSVDKNGILSRTQGGSSGSPATETYWRYQPANGTNPTPGAFASTFIPATYSSRVTTNWIQGYNADRALTSEPMMYTVILPDAEETPGNGKTEWAVVYGSPNGIQTIAMMVVASRSVDTVVDSIGQFSLTFSNGNGPTDGMAFYGYASTVPYLTMTNDDGVIFYKPVSSVGGNNANGFIAQHTNASTLTTSMTASYGQIFIGGADIPLCLGTNGNPFLMYISSETISIGNAPSLGFFQVITPSDNISQVIQLAAGQTSDAFQIQSHGGTVLASISATGGALFSSTVAITGGTTALDLSGYSGSFAIDVVNNAFLRWANTGGTKGIILGVSTDNNTYVTSLSGADIKLYPNATTSPGITIKTTTGQTGINATSPGAQLQVNAATSSTIGQITRGAASQTADLSRWEDSTGAVLSFIDSTGVGHFGSASGPSASYAKIGVSVDEGFYADTSNYAIRMKTGGSNGIYFQTFGGETTLMHLLPTVFSLDNIPLSVGAGISPGATFAVQSLDASAEVAIIKGAPSQNHALTQWQDSSGDVFVSIGANGAFSGSMDTMTYASTISLDVTKGNVHKTTTIDATGNATINASAAGIAGQKITLIAANDATAPKTITFGTNFKSSGTLVGTDSKTAVVEFVSDGTNWYEVSRTTGL